MPEPITPAAAPVEGSTPPAPAPHVATPPAPADLGFSVPDEYRDKKWAAELKSTQDVFKMLAGAQELIGRKGVIKPGENATPEELRAFYTNNGCPDTPEGYEFQTIDPLKDLPRDAEVDHDFKKVLYELGISKDKGEQFIRKAEEIIYNRQKPLFEAKAKTDQVAAEFAKQTFGDESNVVIAETKARMKEALKDTPELGALLDSVKGQNEVILTAYAKRIHDLYTQEPLIKPSTVGANTDSSDIKQQFQALSAKKIAVKTDANMPGHIKTMQLQEINNKISAIGAKANAAGIDLFKK